mmetsp:Transcript_102309/g.328070  ORF Transcript_102309/g.328070 Transcript_102309/m.328070 type:complete len:718 (+) Transcript_102309:4497-6650(+)
MEAPEDSLARCHCLADQSEPSDDLVPPSMLLENDRDRHARLEAQPLPVAQPEELDGSGRWRLPGQLAPCQDTTDPGLDYADLARQDLPLPRPVPQPRRADLRGGDLAPAHVALRQHVPVSRLDLPCRSPPQHEVSSVRPAAPIRADAACGLVSPEHAAPEHSATSRLLELDPRSLPPPHIQPCQEAPDQALEYDSRAQVISHALPRDEAQQEPRDELLVLQQLPPIRELVHLSPLRLDRHGRLLAAGRLLQRRVAAVQRLHLRGRRVRRARDLVLHLEARAVAPPDLLDLQGGSVLHIRPPRVVHDHVRVPAAVVVGAPSSGCHGSKPGLGALADRSSMRQLLDLLLLPRHLGRLHSHDLLRVELAAVGLDAIAGKLLVATVRSRHPQCIRHVPAAHGRCGHDGARARGGKGCAAELRARAPLAAISAPAALVQAATAAEGATLHRAAAPRDHHVLVLLRTRLRRVVRDRGRPRRQVHRVTSISPRVSEAALSSACGWSTWQRQHLQSRRRRAGTIPQSTGSPRVVDGRVGAGHPGDTCGHLLLGRIEGADAPAGRVWRRPRLSLSVVWAQLQATNRGRRVRPGRRRSEAPPAAAARAHSECGVRPGRQRRHRRGVPGVIQRRRRRWITASKRRRSRHRGQPHHRGRCRRGGVAAPKGRVCIHPARRRCRTCLHAGTALVDIVLGGGLQASHHLERQRVRLSQPLPGGVDGAKQILA